MKATLAGRVIAESDDIVECAGYAYFPSAAVRTEWLEKAPKTRSDRACPHGVQFYDAVIDGVRHERVAWSLRGAASRRWRAWRERFGFWEEVEVC